MQALARPRRCARLSGHGGGRPTGELTSIPALLTRARSAEGGPVVDDELREHRDLADLRTQLRRHLDAERPEQRAQLAVEFDAHLGDAAATGICEGVVPLPDQRRRHLDGASSFDRRIVDREAERVAAIRRALALAAPTHVKPQTCGALRRAGAVLINTRSWG
jgi:hypothetical protein